MAHSQTKLSPLAMVQIREAQGQGVEGLLREQDSSAHGKPMAWPQHVPRMVTRLCLCPGQSLPRKDQWRQRGSEIVACSTSSRSPPSRKSIVHVGMSCGVGSVVCSLVRLHRTDGQNFVCVCSAVWRGTGDCVCVCDLLA